jgi:hypothetical protein
MKARLFIGAVVLAVLVLAAGGLLVNVSRKGLIR